MAYKSFMVAFGLISFLLFYIQTALAFTIAVSPARVEETLTTRPKTRTIKVINYGSKPTTVAVRVAHFDLDEQNKVREIAPTRQSLDQWLIVRPLKLNIKPGKTATIRFAIRPLARPTPGEHRAVIFLEQNDVRNDKSPDQLNLAYRIGVVVYAYADPKRVKSRLHGISVSKSGLSLDVESLGNAHSRINGMYGIWPVKTYPGDKRALAAVRNSNALIKRKKAVAGALVSGPLPAYPVLPGYRRTVTNGWHRQLPAGSYRIVTVGKAGEVGFAKVLPLDIK